MGIFPGLQVFLIHCLDGLTMDEVLTLGDHVQLFLVNPFAMLPVVVPGRRQGVIPYLSW